MDDYNIGDIIELAPHAMGYGKVLKCAFQVEVIGKNMGVIFVLLPQQYGIKIDYARSQKYNIETKHIGKYGYHFHSHEITKRIKEGKISVNINEWRNFVYGKQIKAEKLSEPPLSQRAFEFL